MIVDTGMYYDDYTNTSSYSQGSQYGIFYDASEAVDDLIRFFILRKGKKPIAAHDAEFPKPRFYNIIIYIPVIYPFRMLFSKSGFIPRQTRSKKKNK